MLGVKRRLKDRVAVSAIRACSASSPPVVWRGLQRTVTCPCPSQAVHLANLALRSSLTTPTCRRCRHSVFLAGPWGPLTGRSSALAKVIKAAGQPIAMHGVTGVTRRSTIAHTRLPLAATQPPFPVARRNAGKRTTCTGRRASVSACPELPFFLREQKKHNRRRQIRGDEKMDETTTTLMSINAVLEEHARQIQTLVAANRALDEKHQAQVERHQAQVDVVKAEYREKCDSLERRCGVLEARCSSLERSIQVLKKDVEWTYKAPDIPRRHWIEQGRDEEYADNMERFLRAIKYDVEYIRNASEEYEDHYYADCLENENAPTILHDDALLPHFKELADAIQVTTAEVEILD
ncbi:hypothetical protein THAOC_14312 [Thalassiosira oceanica]|uniref:Uncharacterized protein n=1 Tax=Thalassiosira oceanica TaxID=159749 RepID=K0SV44_THAOC|nr:hypothetical protein THAOC_14312 [Thalassiosira oceanica]|eukprot:EJK64901.1 hypothetical protein THAOC_14312 [Thalassiosira oceanica]